LREKSLDCIAELLSRKKGWHYVTATALREQEDSAEVDIARNSGFHDDNDEEFHKAKFFLAANILELSKCLIDIRPRQVADRHKRAGYHWQEMAFLRTLLRPWL
jgi:hypothetical protein